MTSARLVQVWARLPADPVPLVIAIVAGFLLSNRIGVVTEWHVMTDELLYPEIAQGVLDGHFFPGRVRGEDSGVRNVLFSYLIAPFYGTMSNPDAWRASLTLNAWLMASTAIPAFMLTRVVVGRRVSAYLVAVSTVSIPWMVQSANLLTEATAYATFVWWLWATHRTLVRRSAGADALAVALLVLADLARTQFLVLAPVLPIAAFVHEFMVSVAERPDGRDARASIADALRAVWRSHRLLWVIVVIGGLYVALRGTDLLGTYAQTGAGDLLPPGFGRAISVNLAGIAIGLGALPLAFAIAFATGQLFAPRERPEHAFAVLSLLSVAILTVAVTSFELRFSAGLQERYLFYIAPVILVGFAAFFTRRRGLAWAVFGGAVAGFVLTRPSYVPTLDLVGFASPEAAFYPVIYGRAAQVSGWFGSQPDVQILLWPGLFVGVVALTLAQRRFGPRIFGPIGAVTAVFFIFQLNYILPRVMADLDVSTLGIYGPRTDAQRAWVDRATDKGDVVGVMGGAVNSRGGVPFVNAFVDTAAVWDVEFWNRRVATVWNAATLAPVYEAEPEFAAGELELGGPVRPTHIVMPTSNPAFAPRGTPVADNGSLTLYRLAGQPPAAWVSRGIGTDGRTTAGTDAFIRVFGRERDTARVWKVRVLATGGAAKGRRVEIRFGQSKKTQPISAAVDLKVGACVAAGEAKTARVRPYDSSPSQREGAAGIQVLQITAEPTTRTC